MTAERSWFVLSRSEALHLLLQSRVTLLSNQRGNGKGGLALSPARSEAAHTAPQLALRLTSKS